MWTVSISSILHHTFGNCSYWKITNKTSHWTECHSLPPTTIIGDCCSISDLTVTCPIPCPHSQAPQGLPSLPFCFLHLEWPHSQRLGPGPFLFSFCAFSGNISLAVMSAIVSDYSLCSDCSSSSRPSGLRLEILTWGLSDPLSAASKFINLDSQPPTLTHLISPLTHHHPHPNHSATGFSLWGSLSGLWLPPPPLLWPEQLPFHFFDTWVFWISFYLSVNKQMDKQAILEPLPWTKNLEAILNHLLTTQLPSY